VQTKEAVSNQRSGPDPAERDEQNEECGSSFPVTPPYWTALEISSTKEQKK
jgi:hypothetical protein